MKKNSWKQTLASAILIVASVLYVWYLNFNSPQESIAINSNSGGGSAKTPPTSVSTTPPAIQTSTPATPTQKPSGLYTDGTYTGSVADAYYGSVQVAAVVSGGKISAVNFLQYPNDRSNSIMISERAMPILQSEAIQAQNANVDIVSGATDTSMAFQQSLGSALAEAKN